MATSGYTRVNITLPNELIERYKEYQASNTGYEAFQLSNFVKKSLDKYLKEKGYPERIDNSSGSEQKGLPGQAETATGKVLQKGQNKEQMIKNCANPKCRKEFKTNNPRKKYCKSSCRYPVYHENKKIEKED
jgi:hypothetical protein